MSTLDNASPTALHLYKLVPVYCNSHTRELDNDVCYKYDASLHRKKTFIKTYVRFSS